MKRQLRVIVNGIALSAGGGKTVGVNLMRSLPTVSEDMHFLFLAPKDIDYEQLSIGPGNQIGFADRRPFNNLWRVYFDQYQLARLAKSYQADIIFTLNNLGPIVSRCPHLVLFHNPHYVYSSSAVNRRTPLTEYGSIKVQRSLFKLMSRRVDRFIAQTPVMAMRLSQQYNIPQNRISVVPNAISEEHFRSASPHSEIAHTMRSYSTAYRLLYLTRYYSHKNLEIIPETLKILRQMNIDDVVCFITVDESQHPNASHLLKRIKDYGLENHVINLGPVSFEQLANVYKASDAIIMPTLLESLSGTYLEAMHYSRPILTSDLDFAHSICGDAALYFDPLSPEDIAKQIQQSRLLSTSQQASLSSAAKERVKNYFITWPEIAQRLIGIIRKTASMTH